MADDGEQSRIECAENGVVEAEPIIDVCATTTSPAESAKTTMKNSGKFPSVDCSKPVTAGPKRSPTCSVESETIQASPARAIVAIANVSSDEAPV